MNEHDELNNKYKKIDAIEQTVANSDGEKPAKKEKKVKPPKEKKVKEPKPPKEKKVKEPKPPKEKKVKEPKPPKEKKVKEPKPPKEKKVKEPKPPKEKKVKEPKPPKEKKVKEPKPPKEKKVKEPKPPKEKKPREPMTGKDYATIGIAVFALLLVVGLLVVKFYPRNDNPTNIPEQTSSADEVSNIQVNRDGVPMNIVQSDIPDVFYGFTQSYELQYYQYFSNKMSPVQSTGKISAEVDMGNQVLPVTIEYVELGGQIFGIGLFRADKNESVYFYDTVVFKLTNLPEAYAEEGKALLLASSGTSALNKNDILWPESFVVDLNTGKTSRFLKIINRTMDMNGAGVQDFCMLTKAGYDSTSSFIPFITAREYEADSGKQDIFIKQGAKETLFASDIYGKFLLTDGDSVIYMKKAPAGFDVIRKTGDEEKVVFTLYGTMSTDYLMAGEYIFNTTDGKLYNLKTGEEKTIVGYRMTPEMIKVSPNGKYLVMIGTVKNILDYQIHIFNLETNEYSRYVDKNHSTHLNLSFINNTTVVYTAVDPNHGFEYVSIDVAKTK